MTFEKYLRDAINVGFSGDIHTTRIVVVLLMALVLGMYIYFIYRFKSKSSFYSRDFNHVLAALPVVTASIVLAMQSSIVISLGMVGALSIVRFRNAVKNSLDLLYLFWSISVGIVVGAGLFEIALMASFVVTMLLIVLDMIPARRAPYILVIHADAVDVEQEIMAVLHKHTNYCRIRSREISAMRMHLIAEIRTDAQSALVGELAAHDHVHHVNLLSHDGEMRI